MDRHMRRAVFLQLFFKWDGELYHKHYDSVYKRDTTPMSEASMAAKDENKIMHEAGDIANELRALKPVTVE